MRIAVLLCFPYSNIVLYRVTSSFPFVPQVSKVPVEILPNFLPCLIQSLPSATVGISDKKYIAAMYGYVHNTRFALFCSLSRSICIGFICLLVYVWKAVPLLFNNVKSFMCSQVVLFVSASACSYVECFVSFIVVPYFKILFVPFVPEVAYFFFADQVVFEQPLKVFAFGFACQKIVTGKHLVLMILKE